MIDKPVPPEEITGDEKAVPVVSILDAVETDADACENGKWFDDVWEEVPGAKVRLRRFTASQSVNVRQRLMRKYRKFAGRGGTYPPEIEIKMLIDQMAESIIVDWQGFYDREGKEIPFSPEAAKILLKHIDFRAPLLELSIRMDGFRTEEKKEVVGN